MQPTTRFHNGIPKAILQEADGVSHDSVTFHPTNGVFNPNSDGGNTTIGRLLTRSEFSSRRCFRRLENRNPLPEESLEALILIQAAARGQGIARHFCQAL